MIPFIDLKVQNDALRGEIEAALGRVLDQGAYALGPEVAAFEETFAGICNVPHAVAVASGTAALHLAFAALDIGPGDEVIVPPFTFIATASAVRYLGATPVFADIDAETYCLDPAAVEAALTPRTRAIVPVHLFGQPADMDPIRAVAANAGVPVIEDAAQAHAAEYRGVRTGGLGLMGCFSFYPTKNLGALGEGGLVTTHDEALARKLRLLRDWGQEEKYIHAFLAYNARMEGFQGAVLNAKVPHLERWTAQRRAHAERYGKALAAVGIAPPVEAEGRRHVYHVYNIRVRDRARVMAALLEREIGTAIVYPRALHLQPAFADLGHREGDFPQAERAAAEVLSLPMYPELPEDAPDRVAEALGEIVGAG